MKDQYVVLLEKTLNENKKLQEQISNLTKQLSPERRPNSSTNLQQQSKTPAKSPKSPHMCKSSARICYNELLSKEDFDGFDLSLTFSDPRNKEILKRLVRAIQDENSGQGGCLFSAGEIKVAVRRYFKSLKDKKHKEETGKDEEHKTKCRRQSRINENRRRLKQGLSKKKKNWPIEKKSKVAQILTPKFMDDEESDYEELEDGRRLHMGFKVKVLPWIHPRVRNVMKDLMEEYLRSLPIHQKSSYRQRRVIHEEESQKQKPADCPDWVTAGTI